MERITEKVRKLLRDNCRVSWDYDGAGRTGKIQHLITVKHMESGFSCLFRLPDVIASISDSGTFTEDDIANRIADYFNSAKDMGNEEAGFSPVDYILKNVVYEPVGNDASRIDRSKGFVCKNYLDFSFFYAVPVERTNGKEGYFRVSDDIMRFGDIDMEELDRCARKNSMKGFSFLSEENGDVLTVMNLNSPKVLEACVLLCPALLTSITSYYRGCYGSFFITAPCANVVNVFPAENCNVQIVREGLDELISSIPPEAVLSDSIYLYDADGKELSIYED